MEAAEIEVELESMREDLITETSRYRVDMQPINTGMAAQLPQLPHIRSILFDIYGTLLISAAGEVGSDAESTGLLNTSRQKSSDIFRSVLEKSGYSVGPGSGVRAEELYHGGIALVHEEAKKNGTRYPEVNIIEIWDRLLSSLLEEELIEENRAAGPGDRRETDAQTPGRDRRAHLRSAVRSAFYFELSTNVVSPMPGAAELIARASAAGMKLGIVSNAQFYTPIVMEALLGEEPKKLGFSEELCIWSWRRREAKPAQGLFQTALEGLEREYGIPAREVLYIGNDMRNDIWPAKKLGCRTALFAGDKRSLRLRTDDERVRNTQADATITELTQIASLVPGL